MKPKYTFTEALGVANFQIGDFLLFQEHKENGEISKPILAIYMGCFAADQTLGFNYIKWVNENRYTLFGFRKTRVYNEVQKIDCHIEWNDKIDILGYWKYRPTWKEIIKAYRGLVNHNPN